MIKGITGGLKIFGEATCRTSAVQAGALLSLASLATTPSYVNGVPRGLGISELINKLNEFVDIKIDGFGNALIEPYATPSNINKYEVLFNDVSENLFLVPFLVQKKINFELNIEKENFKFYANCLAILKNSGLHFIKKSEYRYLTDYKSAEEILEKNIKIDLSQFSFLEGLFALCLFASLRQKLYISNFPKDPRFIEILDALDLANKEKSIFKFTADTSEAVVNFSEPFSGFRANVKFSFSEAGFYSFLTAGLEGRLTLKNVSLADILPLRAKISNWGLLEEQDEEGNLKIWYEGSHFREKTNILIEPKEYPGFTLNWSLMAVVYLISKKVPFVAKFQKASFLKDLALDLNRMGADLKSYEEGNFYIFKYLGQGNLVARKIVFTERILFTPMLLAAFLSKGKSSLSNFSEFEALFPSLVENLKNLNLID